MDKSERFGLVLSIKEKIALRRIAEAEGGLSLAASLRRLIYQEALRRGLWNGGVEYEECQRGSDG